MRTSVRAIVINGNNFLVMDRDKFGHKFVSLIGGEVEIGEELLNALVREVKEESSIEIANPRLVVEEDAGEIFGLQYIYLCDYVGGEPKLEANSIESKINEGGQNIYTPKWLPLDRLADSKLLPKELKELILTFLKDGFPDHPVKLSIPKESEL